VTKIENEQVLNQKKVFGKNRRPYSHPLYDDHLKWMTIILNIIKILLVSIMLITKIGNLFKLKV